MTLKLEDKDGHPWTASTNLGWIVLIVVISSGIAFFGLALYLALWIRSKGRSALPLIGFLSVLTSPVLMFPLRYFSAPTWIGDDISTLIAIMWIAATFALRHEIKDYYKEAEGWDIEIGPFFTLFFSVVYINYCINPAILHGNSAPDTVTSLNLTNPPAGNNLRK
jgi:hypothetical protein